MKFREVSAGDAFIIGKVIYDVDSNAPLGVAQLQSRHQSGGFWLTLKVKAHHEIEIIHRDRVLIEDNDKPPVGSRIRGDPESQLRRERGEKAGASWKDRPEQQSEGLDPEDPDVFSSEKDAAEAHKTVPRIEGTKEHKNPKTGQLYEVTPAGGPLGRKRGSHGMTLDYVKLVLGQAAEELRKTGVDVVKVNTNVAQEGVKIKSAQADVSIEITFIVNALNAVIDQQQRIIQVTQGHRVQAPTQVLGKLDQVRERLQSYLANLRILNQQLEEAMSTANKMTNSGAEANTLLRGAADELSRYRVSF